MHRRRKLELEQPRTMGPRRRRRRPHRRRIVRVPEGRLCQSVVGGARVDVGGAAAQEHLEVVRNRVRGRGRG